MGRVWQEKRSCSTPPGQFQWLLTRCGFWGSFRIVLNAFSLSPFAPLCCLLKQYPPIGGRRRRINHISTRPTLHTRRPCSRRRFAEMFPSYHLLVIQRKKKTVVPSEWKRGLSLSAPLRSLSLRQQRIMGERDTQ